MATTYVRRVNLKATMSDAEVAAYWRFMFDEAIPVFQKVAGVRSIRIFSGAGALRAETAGPGPLQPERRTPRRKTAGIRTATKYIRRRIAFYFWGLAGLSGAAASMRCGRSSPVPREITPARA